jgi:hypothetical protein
MAGNHADRGDTSHRIVSGEVPVVGLEVITNNLDRGRIIATDERRMSEDCGWYCPAWHTVELHTSYDGKPLKGTTIMNCDRLTTRSPR